MNDPQPEGSHGKLHRTTKILSHARWRGGVAARGARAAGAENPAHWHHRRLASLERLPARVAPPRLPRRRQHRLRLCVWRRSARTARRGRGGARSSPGGCHCDLRHACKLSGQAGHHHDSHRHDLDRRSRARRARAKPRPTGRKYHRQHLSLARTSVPSDCKFSRRLFQPSRAQPFSGIRTTPPTSSNSKRYKLRHRRWV
jgi:hypothetical protein